MRPKLALVTFREFGVPTKPRKFVWLKTLKASPRSCSMRFSPKRMFLKSEKSTRYVGGPLTTPRGEVPGVLERLVAVVAGFGWTHAVLNQASSVCGAFAFGSQIRFGRLPATSAVMLPKPDASNDEVTRVNGSPDCAVMM